MSSQERETDGDVDVNGVSTENRKARQRRLERCIKPYCIIYRWFLSEQVYSKVTLGHYGGKEQLSWLRRIRAWNANKSRLIMIFKWQREKKWRTWTKERVLPQVLCVANRVRVTGMTVGVVLSSVSNQRRTSLIVEARDDELAERKCLSDMWTNPTSSHRSGRVSSRWSRLNNVICHSLVLALFLEHRWLVRWKRPIWNSDFSLSSAIRIQKCRQLFAGDSRRRVFHLHLIHSTETTLSTWRRLPFRPLSHKQEQTKECVVKRLPPVHLTTASESICRSLVLSFGSTRMCVCVSQADRRVSSVRSSSSQSTKQRNRCLSVLDKHMETQTNE